jgi:RimJ/RimL family protein N-acetyltransferase
VQRLIPNHPEISVRLLRPTDKAALLDLFARLGERSRMRRFLAPKPSLSAKEVAYLTEVDGRRHAALVAVGRDGAFVGVARYACAPGETEVADVAFAVADAWQGRGIGTALGALLVEHARVNGITRLQATTLPENGPSRRLLSRMGFRVCAIADGILDVDLDLAAAAERDVAARDVAARDAA